MTKIKGGAYYFIRKEKKGQNSKNKKGSGNLNI